MTVPAAVARARRAAKVDALGARSQFKGERDAAQAASERLKAGVPVLASEPVCDVLSHLASLGIELVNDAESRLQGRIGRKYVETDATLHSILQHLVEHTVSMRNMNSIEAAEFFGRLRAGRKIMLPRTHPSRLETREAPITSVQTLSGGTHTPGRRK